MILLVTDKVNLEIIANEVRIDARVSRDIPISLLKKMLSNQLGESRITIADCYFRVHGKVIVMDDNHRLREYGISDGDLVEICARKEVEL